MASNIKFKRSSVQNRVPTTAQLELGELALNTYDGKLYTEINTGSATVVEIGSKLSSLVVDGDNGGGNGDVVFHGATAGRDLTWDHSINRLHFADSADLVFGDSNDLIITHNGSHSLIQDAGQGHLILLSDSLYLQNTSGNETYFKGINNAQVDLYHNNNIRVTTTDDGADVSGTGSLKLPVGTTAQRNSSPTAGDMRYNSTTGSFEGYTTGWGALGGESGVGIGSTSVNPGSGVVHPLVGVGYTTINFVGAGLSVTGYGTTIVVDLGNAVSRKYGRRIHSYTATANQTAFTGLSYTDGASQVSVYLNGAKLSAATYTATSGSTVVLGTGASVGDEVEILVIDSGVDISRTVHSYTATAGQTVFSGLGYEDGGDLDVYLNGIRLAQSDYTANNGTILTLAAGASVGDLLEIVDMGPGASWKSGFGGDADDVFRMNGGVGIGTTNPTDKLNIVGNVEILGILTATTFKGDGSQLTGITQTTINNNGNNKIITGSGTANTLEAEGSFTYNGTDEVALNHVSTSENTYLTLNANANRRKAILFKNANTTQGCIGLGDSDEGTSTSLFLSAKNDVAGASPHMSIDSSGNVQLLSTDAGSSAGPELKLFRNSASPADADYLGQIKFAGESDTGVERNYAKITGKILDASNGTEDGIIEFAHIKAGSQTITGRWRSDSLQLLNGTNMSIAGNLTVTGDLQVDGTNTVVNSTTMTVDDKNIVLGSGAANDAAADGGGITLESGAGNKTWNWVDSTDAWTSSEHIHIPGTNKLLLGTSSDFQIFNDGTHNNIKSTNNGHINVYIPDGRSFSVGNSDFSENIFMATEGGACTLYHNSGQKLATQSNGVTVTGGVYSDGLICGDSDKIELGDSADLQLYHSSSWNYIDNIGAKNFVIRVNGTENALVAIPDGATILYHNGSEKITTTSTGVSVTGNITSSQTVNAQNLTLTDADPAINFVDSDANPDYQIVVNSGHFMIKDSTAAADRLYINASTTTITNNLNLNSDTTKLQIGASQDLQIWHDGSNSYVNDNGTGNLYFQVGGAAKFNTQSGGVQFYGSIYGDDNNKIELGNDQDLQIFHNGSNSIIKDNGTGDLKILASDLQLKNAADNQFYITAVQNGAVNLYHAGSTRLSTSNPGVTVNGTLTVNSTSSYAANMHLLKSSGQASYTIGSGNAGGAYLILDGDSNGDASGSDYSYLAHDTNGDVYLVADNPSANGSIFLKSNGGSYQAVSCHEGGKVELRYQNNHRIETDAEGVAITGRTKWTGGTSAATQSVYLSASSQNVTQIGIFNGHGYRQGFCFYNNGSSSYKSWGMITDQQNLYFSQAAYNIGNESNLNTGWTPRITVADGGNVTFAGTVHIQDHEFKKHNDHNIILTNNTNDGSSGICGQSSNGNFKWQIYGNGVEFGFLDSTWGNWDLRKIVGGELYVDISGTQYMVKHKGNSGRGIHTNAVSKMTSSGTWSRPNYCTLIKVTVTGGGGGGGSHNADDAHGGGGAGGTSIKWIDVTSISSVSVTVGSGGGGGAGNQQSSGNGGGSSSFGSHCSASGGGHPTAWGRGGGGGGASGGDINLQGGGGGSGNIDGQGNEEAGGTGGGSYWGGGQSGGTAWGQRHSGGTYGTGGAGSHANTDNDGADGNAGIVVIEHFF